MFRLALPERVPLLVAVTFASLLFVVQQLEHTSLYFSACTFMFLLVITLAFNMAGGLTRPSGGYIFFYSVLGVILGLCSKALLGEAADSNLSVPRLDITIYVVGACGLWFAAYVSRRFCKKRPFLINTVSEFDMPNATIGCLAVGLALSVLNRVGGRGQGTAVAALVQINRFTELAVILGVTYMIRRTGGRRSVNVPVLAAAGGLFFINGLIGFSKEGLFSPFACWAVAAAAQRYRMSKGLLISGVIALIFISQFLVPYSQYGRSLDAGSLSGNIRLSGSLLSDLPTVRARYNASQANALETEAGGYFNKPEGLLDRLQMISPDDHLNQATELKGAFGYFPILVYFENLVPHILWPGKPNYQWGNAYAHEAGIDLGEEDFTTGISFTPTAEGFHLGRWVGLFVLAPLIWSMGFLVFDSLCGDVRESPWGLLTLTIFAHTAPEGMLGGVIYSTFYLGFAIVFAAVLTGYLMPIIGSLFAGPQRRPLQGTIGAVPRRVPVAPAGLPQS